MVRPKTARAHTQQQPIDKSEIQIMLEQMLANRRIIKNQCNIKNAKTKLKSAIGINSGIEIWDWNQMLRSHKNLQRKWYTRSNMSVQRRNGQQTWIVTWLCPKFYTPLPDSDIPDALTHQRQKTRVGAMETSTNKHHRVGGWMQNPDGCGDCINNPLPRPEHPA